MATLFLLTLPIGNLGDITLRAQKALEEGTHFIVEDTRSFKQLLNLMQISVHGKKIDSFHDQSEELSLDKIIQLLKEGQDLFLASEAGSPMISDPGFPLVSRAIKEGITVSSIPGVTSVITALEVSGLPPYPFSFLGFFPREQDKQKKMVDFCSLRAGTYLFFESPNRILKTLDYLTDIFPLANFAVARELTKKYESVYRFRGDEFNQFKNAILEKGEFVVLLNWNEEMKSLQAGKINFTHEKTEKLIQLAEEISNQGMGAKLVSKLVAEILDKNSKDIYKLLQK